MARLMRLIVNGRVDPTKLTTHRLPFAEIDKAFHMMETKEDGVIKPLVVFA
jgi:threonine dehydrogenase-like Zn-dependent dehydrogenase